jgi:hypothetical protein
MLSAGLPSTPFHLQWKESDVLPTYEDRMGSIDSIGSMDSMDSRARTSTSVRRIRRCRRARTVSSVSGSGDCKRMQTNKY